jgi:hypothetical protein
MLKKKIWASFQRIIEPFTRKLVIKLSKIWVWDSGSEIRIRKKPIPDPGSGSRSQKGIGSRISDPGSRIPDLGSGSATLPKCRLYFCLIEFID